MALKVSAIRRCSRNRRFLSDALTVACTIPRNRSIAKKITHFEAIFRSVDAQIQSMPLSHRNLGWQGDFAARRSEGAPRGPQISLMAPSASSSRSSAESSSGSSKNPSLRIAFHSSDRVITIDPCHDRPATTLRISSGPKPRLIDSKRAGEVCLPPAAGKRRQHLPVDQELLKQLSSRRLQYDSKARIQLEPKDKMRAHGLPSPDRADAVIGAAVQDLPGFWIRRDHGG